ncbi:MAG TPA: hypothetical protein VGM08_02210 [Candidatus Saccharimonadales bacterium]|jgi:hypothetical protein
MPYLQRAANATIGLDAGVGRFPELAQWWSQGREIPREEFELPEGATQRAVIMGKAYTAIGGTVVLADAAKGLGLTTGPFHAYRPALGTRLPGPSEDGGGKPAIGALPLICVDGRDMEEAQRKYVNTLRAMNIAVERDGERYGPESERPFTDYYWTTSAV